MMYTFNALRKVGLFMMYQISDSDNQNYWSFFKFSNIVAILNTDLISASI